MSEQNKSQSSEQSAEQQKLEKKLSAEKRKKWFQRGLIIVLIVIIILLLLRRCDGSDNGDYLFDLTPDQNATSEQVEQRSEQEIIDELNQKVADGMINISMNMSPVFETGTSEGNLLIVNDEINKYPQIVEIYRTDTEEKIYTSGAIAVGSRVEMAKLDVDLEPGTYPCLAYFNAVNAETGVLIGQAAAEIEITVVG